jgi:type II secretory pathway component PulJ
MAIRNKILKIFLKQQGFSLIQLMIGLAITTILGTVITVSLWQTITVDGASNKHMQAISQVENAVFYLNRDIQMSLPADTYQSGFPLELQSGATSITYSLVSPHDGSPAYLQRNKDGLTQVIASHIDTNTNLTSSFYSGGKLTVTITVTTGGFMSATESRTLVAMPRLNQR